MRGVVAATAISSVLTVALASPAYAYLDPGTGSMLLQAIIGAVAGLLVMGRVYWDRLKVFVGRLGTSQNTSGGSDPGARS